MVLLLVGAELEMMRKGMIVAQFWVTVPAFARKTEKN